MYKRVKRLVVFNLLVVLILALMVPSVAFAQGPEGGFTATPLAPGSTFTASKSEAGGALTVPVIVKLEGDSLASYRGGVPGLAPTSPAVTGEKPARHDIPLRSQAYLKYLDKQQKDVEAAAAAAIPGVQVTYEFDVVLNARRDDRPGRPGGYAGSAARCRGRLPGRAAASPDRQQPAVHRRADGVEPAGRPGEAPARV